MTNEEHHSYCPPIRSAIPTSDQSGASFLVSTNQERHAYGRPVRSRDVCVMPQISERTYRSAIWLNECANSSQARKKTTIQLCKYSKNMGFCSICAGIFRRPAQECRKPFFFLQTAQHVILITDDNLVPLLRMPDQERAPFPTMTNEERHLFSTNHERAPFLLFLANHKRYSYCRSIRKNHSFF